MPKRRVIIELKHSQGIADMAITGQAATRGPAAVTKAAPALAGLDLDPNFAPVAVPLAALPVLAAARAMSADDLDDLQTPTNNSYLLRGEIEESKLDSVTKAAEGHDQIAGIYSDPNIEVCPICPGDPARGNAGDVERLLCVPRLRARGMDGRGVLVAIVDTGINMRHLNAQGKNPGLDGGRSWRPPSAPPTAPGDWPVGHGTMCAYDVCIAAPRCTLLDIALLTSSRPGGSVMDGLLSDAVLAYRHLLNVMLAPRRPGELRSLVVNNSWGMFHPSWDFPVGHPGNYSDNPNHPFNRIVATLERAGADILFAAGNCGRDCPDGRCRGVTTRTIYGANSHPAVLTIGGVDVTGLRVGYSSVGPGRLTARKPDLCGFTHFVGSRVYSADGGTSAATPVVAGVVAAVRSRRPFNPGLGSSYPAVLRNLLRSTALDRGAVGFDFDYGWGIVNGCRLSTIVPASSAEASFEELLDAMHGTAGISGAKASPVPDSEDASPSAEPVSAGTANDAGGCGCGS